MRVNLGPTPKENDAPNIYSWQRTHDASLIVCRTLSRWFLSEIGAVLVGFHG